MNRPTMSHPFFGPPSTVVRAEHAVRANLVRAEELVRDWSISGGGRKLSQEEQDGEQRRIERFLAENRDVPSKLGPS